MELELNDTNDKLNKFEDQSTTLTDGNEKDTENTGVKIKNLKEIIKTNEKTINEQRSLLNEITIQYDTLKETYTTVKLT